ncbi:MAG: hypothetical protein E7667_02220 [Ruminococcaceae bacterium]|nr:hypothetical protein [Oscillospiraceae bacterium]
MYWIIYYVVAIAVNAVCVIAFREHININLESVIPVAMIILSIFEIRFFSNGENFQKNTMYTSQNSLNDNEKEKMYLCMKRAFLVAIPLFVPFFFFFSKWIKILSVFIMFFTLIGGGLYFRIKHGSKVEHRWQDESNELKEQQKKEEMGKFK